MTGRIGASLLAINILCAAAELFVGDYFMAGMNGMGALTIIAVMLP